MGYRSDFCFMEFSKGFLKRSLGLIMVYPFSFFLFFFFIYVDILLFFFGI